MTDIPPGICQCGCGKRTKRIILGCASRGYIAGEFRKYSQGHAGVGSGKIRPPARPASDRTGIRHTAEVVERLRVARREQMDAEARKKRVAERAEEMRRAALEGHPAVQLYRETRELRMPAIKEREAKILEAVKRSVAESDARAHEARHRGRPKTRKALPPMFIRKSPDALIASVSEWHGER